MGWSIGFDTDWNRDIGYGVVAYCDHPECNEEINRGLGYVCANEEPRGGDGCGLYFCSKHKGHYHYPESEDEEDNPDADISDCCERCRDGKEPFIPKPDHPHWAWWKMNSGSWAEWRSELPPADRKTWKEIAKQYHPSKSDIQESKEDS